MPEGHTTHRLAAAHQRNYAGAPVAVSSPQGRFAAAAAKLDGRVLQRAEAHGKHLFHIYDPDLVVHVHLGLYGSFIESILPVRPPQGQVRMRLVGSTHWTDLRGPAACELLTEAETDMVRARLGPDPLRGDADSDRAWARISQSRAPLATLLMGSISARWGPNCVPSLKYSRRVVGVAGRAVSLVVVLVSQRYGACRSCCRTLS